MCAIYRGSRRHCNCGFISKNILVGYTDFRMSNVGSMVVKIRESEEEWIK